MTSEISVAVSGAFVAVLWYLFESMDMQVAKIVAVGVGTASFLYVLRQYFQGGVCKSKARLDGKVAIVTGSNTGIGKYTVVDLVNRGAKVYMACRSLDKARAARNDILETTSAKDDQVIILQLDNADLASVRQFAKEFKSRESRLDLLINNAGVMGIAKRTLTKDGFEMQIGTNHFGHFLLTNLLLDRLLSSAPSRVVSVSSLAHSVYPTFEFDDINMEKSYGPWKAYANSKLANVMFTRELGKRLKGTGVTAYSVHPGGIATDLQRHHWFLNNFLFRFTTAFFWKSIKQGAQTTINCAVSEDLANETGKYYSDCAAKKPSAAALVDADCEKLWNLSVEMIGLKPEEMVKQVQ